MKNLLLIMLFSALIGAWIKAVAESSPLLEDKLGTPIPKTPMPTPQESPTPGPSPTPLKMALNQSFLKT